MIYILAIFLPPLALLLKGRVGAALLNCVLCLLFWVPGVVHAIIVIAQGESERRHKEMMYTIQATAIAAQGGKPPPPPTPPDHLPGWLVAALIVSALFMFVGTYRHYTQTPRPAMSAPVLPAGPPTLTMPPSLALPGPVDPPAPEPAVTPTPAAPATPATPELPAISAWSYAEVVKAHGEPEAKDRATGWATWPTFKARFTSGKVEEIAAR